MVRLPFGKVGDGTSCFTWAKEMHYYSILRENLICGPTSKDYKWGKSCFQKCMDVIDYIYDACSFLITKLQKGKKKKNENSLNLLKYFNL